MKALIILGLTFFLVACGIFNKSRTRDKVRVQKEKAEVVIEDKGVTVVQKDKDVEFTEIIIRMPKERDPIAPDSLAKGYENLHEAIVNQIRNSETTTIRHQTTRERNRSEIDTGSISRSLELKMDSMKKESDLQKESDTTWLANFNPWVILGVAAMAIGAVFLYFKLK